METASKIRTIRSRIREIDFEGKSLLSINDLTNDQIYGLFELALTLTLSAVVLVAIEIEKLWIRIQRRTV